MPHGTFLTGIVLFEPQESRQDDHVKKRGKRGRRTGDLTPACCTALANSAGRLMPTRGGDSVVANDPETGPGRPPKAP